jgi:hypothetical protein
VAFLLQRLTLPQFALRAVARAINGDWLVLVAPDAYSEAVGAGLLSELKSLAGTNMHPALLTNPDGARALGDRLAREGKRVAVIVTGIDGFSSDEWAHLDVLRSRLSRSGPTILIVSRAAVEAMAEAAPNILSWIGGSIWEANLEGEGLTEAARQARLADLRAWSRITDEELIRRAESGELGREPEFVEWLALLGRSDLVAQA